AWPLGQCGHGVADVSADLLPVSLGWRQSHYQRLAPAKVLGTPPRLCGWLVRHTCVLGISRRPHVSRNSGLVELFFELVGVILDPARDAEHFMAEFDRQARGDPSHALG